MTPPAATSFVDLSLDGTPISSSADLTAALEALIESGTLGPGDRLPSVRDAAAELGLAPNTVAAAYKRLRDRSIVVGRGRQGTQVAPSARHRSTISQPLPEGIVDAMSGNPDSSLLPDLSDAIAAAVALPRADYSSAITHQRLRDAATRWLAADGVPTAGITITSGAMDAIERVLSEHLRPGDLVGVEDPGHVPVFDVVASLGLIAVPMLVDSEGVTAGAVAAALASGAKALILTPRAHNPTGAAITSERASEIRHQLDDYPSVLVIEDDHAGPVSGAPLADIGRDRERWALVRSVSKSLGPDLRFAILTGDQETVAAVARRFAAGPGWVSHLLQHTVATLLDNPATTALIERAADTYRLRRELLIGLLAEGGVHSTGPSGLHVWIPVPDEQAVANTVRDGGFAIRVGSAYRHRAEPAVRVTVASVTDSDIDQIADLILESLTPGAGRHSSAV